MHRADAEDAMDAYCESDPLGTGRRMILRWGKNVKMTVKFGTGGVPTNLRKRARDDDTDDRGGAAVAPGQRDGADRGAGSSDGGGRPPSSGPNCDEGTSASPRPSDEVALPSAVEERKMAPPRGPTYDPAQHSAEAITVVAPSDPRRLKFITTVASFVAKDGSILEQKLIETQSFSPDFHFLTPRDDDDPAHPFSSDSSDDDLRFEEHVFYRWRVYSFAQGDGFSSWRTDPFVMFEPHGRFWIPPPLNTLAAQEEEEAEKRREHTILAAQEERRKLAGKKQDCVTTGAQMRRTNADKGGGLKLNEWERKIFHELLREKLCASQESICEAMAFAFDKSGAAHEISHLLGVAMLESGNGISADTRIARLFLLSDILFNSQQPGVKNAFQYRDAIEAMSPSVFESLGRHGGGRMTKNKLRKAVSSVLGAWTNWSVYNSTFIDDLENKFEGREVNISVKIDEDLDKTNIDEIDMVHISADGDKETLASANLATSAVSTTPRGTWTSADSIDAQHSDDDIDGEVIDDLDGESLNDIDGEELDDVDGIWVVQE